MTLRHLIKKNYECYVASLNKNCDIKTDAIIGCMTMKFVLHRWRYSDNNIH